MQRSDILRSTILKKNFQFYQKFICISQLTTGATVLRKHSVVFLVLCPARLILTIGSDVPSLLIPGKFLAKILYKELDN